MAPRLHWFHRLRRYPRLRWFFRALAGLAITAGLGYWLVLPRFGQPGAARDFTGMTGDPTRGAYVIHMAGSIACHTDAKGGGEPLAGGPVLKSPFGNFFAPNITPDPDHGVGGWSLADFSRDLAQGLSPKGAHYFPAFPYTSYTRMTARDIADLKSYLDRVTPRARPRRRHWLIWPFSDRRFLGVWKWLNFREGLASPRRAADQAWTRGAYLVTGPGHCGECHTARDFLGGFSGPPLAGNPPGPDGDSVPGIANLGSAERGAKAGAPWTAVDIVFALQTGPRPDGDVLAGAMGEVVDQATSHLNDREVAAIARYPLDPGTH